MPQSPMNSPLTLLDDCKSAVAMASMSFDALANHGRDLLFRVDLWVEAHGLSIAQDSQSITKVCLLVRTQLKATRFQF